MTKSLLCSYVAFSVDGVKTNCGLLCQEEHLSWVSVQTQDKHLRRSEDGTVSQAPRTPHLTGNNQLKGLRKGKAAASGTWFQMVHRARACSAWLQKSRPGTRPSVGTTPLDLPGSFAGIGKVMLRDLRFPSTRCLLSVYLIIII